MICAGLIHDNEDHVAIVYEGNDMATPGDYLVYRVLDFGSGVLQSEVSVRTSVCNAQADDLSATIDSIDADAINWPANSGGSGNDYSEGVHSPEYDNWDLMAINWMPVRQHRTSA